MPIPIILFFLTISGVSVFADEPENGSTLLISTKDELITFSTAIVEKQDEFVTINLEDAETYLMNSGKPMIPVVTKIFTFPLGTKIKNIKCSFSGFSEEIIQNPVKPAPKAFPKLSINKLVEKHSETPLMDQNIP